MAQIYISLGSNVEKERYVDLGLSALSETFGCLEVSSLYACEAVGFDGPEFYNLVVGAKTELSIEQLARKLKDIEYAHGRCPDAKKFSPRTLDLDLLLFDDLIAQSPTQVPRPDILNSAFVLWPLTEIAGGLIHPEVNQSYQQLWSAFDKSKQKISQLPLAWQPK
ncbi:2-amino-4-hydroxy-6-hydroxymethyldihydropteridine diphosphokinase [Thalassotalea atypica]|uniref:2-amino-4-hydroxy-6- hydroxymethyldihydropteridine diphosphokinase n=1 Tax=Thalassotalea atypica TaxID=2054316 RepID=UPI0025748AC4|nr:2-amino-4-hydroxy-6-hydroxymethyldihydropteridine diphosphokinase [Thalassotalea atypica]